MKRKNLVTLITEPNGYSKKAVEIYKSLGPVYSLPELRGSKRKNILNKTNILAVGISIKINKSFLEKMPNLRVIASPATGMNHLDLNEIKQRCIKLISLRGRTGFLKNIPSTAEHTMALLLALKRNIPWAHQDSIVSANWDRLAWRGYQLHKKVLGILGFGRLGKIVARYAKAFGMRVLASDPYVSRGAMERRGVKKVDMNTVFKNSDVLSLHVLLTDDTYNLIKERHLRMMKPAAYLINTARAELIEKGALYKALKNKWIAGAAVDVMWDEAGNGSHLKKDPLAAYARKNTNLLISPHIGGATFEAMEITQDFIAELVVKYFKNKR